jgi:hypothetical protein
MLPVPDASIVSSSEPVTTGEVPALAVIRIVPVTLLLAVKVTDAMPPTVGAVVDVNVPAFVAPEVIAKETEVPSGTAALAAFLTSALMVEVPDVKIGL